MTVKELIKTLMELPGDAQVVITQDGRAPDTLVIISVSADRDADGDVLKVHLSS